MRHTGRSPGRLGGEDFGENETRRGVPFLPLWLCRVVDQSRCRRRRETVNEENHRETELGLQCTSPGGRAASKPLVWVITHVLHVRPSGVMFLAAKASSMGANNKVNLEDHVPGLDSHPMAPPAPAASLDSAFPATDQGDRFWRQNWRKEG